jgi:hypothetical protein
LSTSLNGAGQNYWGSGGSNPSFGGANLGSVNPNTNTLVMKLHGVNSWNDGGCDVQTTTMKIRVYLSTAAQPSFTNVNLMYQGSSGNNKFWNNNSPGTDINLLANCSAAGTYNVDIQFDYTNNNTSCGSPTSTSVFTATFIATAPLPIVLSRFEAKNNLLSWTTESESNASHFEVEKSLNSATWSKISEVQAVGNSNRRQDYTFTDEKINKGANYYRLKMVDRDGSFQYSKVISTNNNHKGKVNIFPNPAQDLLNITVESYSDEVIVEIFNLNGQSIKRSSLSYNRLNISDLSEGMYFVQVSDENGQILLREKLLKN